jgi:hypothetical protein
MNKKLLLKLFLIAVSVTIFRTVIQLFMPSTNDGALLPPSIIVKSGLIPVVFTIYGIFVYGSLAVIFSLIQNGLPGKKIIKGLIFGLAFGLMWAIYLFEPSVSTPSSLINLLEYPIADGITLIILGIISGLFVGTNSGVTFKFILPTRALAFLVFPLLLLAARYFAYTGINMDSAYATKPLGTLIWVAIIGLWIGIMYLVFRPCVESKSLLAKAVLFGFCIYGIDLLFFNFFIPLVFEYNIIKVLIRTAIDIVPITFAVLVFELINVKKEAKIISS